MQGGWSAPPVSTANARMSMGLDALMTHQAGPTARHLPFEHAFMKGDNIEDVLEQAFDTKFCFCSPKITFFQRKLR